MWSKELMNGILSEKTFYFYALSSIIFFTVGIYLLFKKNQLKLELNLLDIFLLLFLIYCLIRLLFTEYASIDDTYFLWFAFLTALYFLWKKLLSFDRDCRIDLIGKILIASFFISGTLQAIYGITQLYNISPGVIGAQFKVIGTLGNPDYFAGYLISIAPFALGIYIFSKNQRLFTKFFINLALVTFLICLFILPSTSSRTSWLALSAGIVFILWHRYELTKKIKLQVNTKIKIVFSVILSVVFFGLIIATLYQIKPGSAFGRLFIWKITSEIISENPIFGIGFNRFEVEYNNYQAKYFAADDGTLEEKLTSDNVRHAHNEYLQIWAELGLTGLIIFAGIIVLVFLGNKITGIPPPEGGQLTEKQVVNLSAKASLISLLVFSFFSFPLHILPTLINFIFLLAVVSTTGNYKCVKSFKTEQLLYKTATVFIILFSVLFTIKYLSVFDAFKKWGSTFYLTQVGLYDEAESEYRHLLEVLNTNGEFLFQYGGTLLAAGKHSKAIKLLEESRKRFSDPNLYLALGQCYEALGDYKQAEENYLIAKFIIPHKVYPKYLLVKFYNKNNRLNEAIKTAKEIIEMEVKVETTAAVEIKKEMEELIKRNNQSLY